MTDPAAIAFSAPRPRQGFAARLGERFRLWRWQRRWIGEMANAAAFGRLDDTLTDVGITRAELGVLIDAPADAGRQFEALAGSARDDLSPAELRDAMWVCTRCESREACKRWLRTGVWRYAGDPRCPNAALFRH